MNALRVILLGLVLVALLFIVQPDDAVTVSFVARANDYQATYLYRQAEDYVRLASTRQPWNATFAVRLAELARLRGNFDQATPLIDQAAALGADPLAVADQRARLAEAQGRFEAAASFWQAIVDARPTDAVTSGRLIDAYLRADNWPAAQAAAEQWSQRGSPLSHLLLGKLLALDEPDHAASEFDAAHLAAADEFLLALEPSDPALRALLLGRTFLAQADLTLALRAFDAAIEANPAYAEAYAYAGFVRDQLGRDGRAQLDRAVELDQGLAVARYFRARSAWQRGELDQALSDLQTALELEPSNRVVAAELGRLLMQRGDLAEAERRLIETRDRQPADPIGWLALAELYAGRAYGPRDQAIEVAQQAVQHAPSDAAAHIWLGAAYLLNGDRAAAENELRRALDLKPASALAQLYLGRLYGRDTEAGRAAYERAVALDPAGPIGAQAKRTLALP
jgi:tetratricopeptide (TPR) repeat protein